MDMALTQPRVRRHDSYSARVVKLLSMKLGTADAGGVPPPACCWPRRPLTPPLKARGLKVHRASSFSSVVCGRGFKSLRLDGRGRPSEEEGRVASEGSSAISSTQSRSAPMPVAISHAFATVASGADLRAIVDTRP